MWSGASESSKMGFGEGPLRWLLGTPRLGAEPVLEDAWMRPEMSKLFLVSLAYVWITMGLFRIGMPYLLRDQIAWVTKGEGRWKAAVFGGIAYGVLLVGLALTY